MNKKASNLIVATVVAVLLGLYLITWAGGVSDIHNRIASGVVAAWERRLAGEVDIKPIKPQSRFGVAFAIFPGLIVSQHSWTTSSTGGESGWSLYLWYGVGTKRLWFRGVVA